jgi:hypothetical protein
MNVLVDTSIWSLALRKKDLSAAERIYIKELGDLIQEGRASIIGLIRQEILSGIPDKKQFHRLREALRAFDDHPIMTEDYEKAAEYFNLCRNRGIQGSHVDFLICAIAEGYGMPVFSTDKDFTLYRKHLPIALHEPRKAT